MEISVDIGAIKRNLIKIREKIGLGVKLTFMVKADAYNHGVERVAPAVKHLVDAFGVATAKEGAVLRLIGIENRILVTAFSEKDAADTKFFRLTPVLGTLQDIRQFAKKTEEFDIALDTGMCREGLSEEDAKEAAAFFVANDLAPRGICTHLAYTDGRRDGQLQRFFKMRDYFPLDTSKLHIANSDAALLDEKFWLDEVRVGLAAYGGDPKYSFEPAMRVTAPVEFIKNVKKGDHVGYEGLYVAEKDGQLAFVRSGYYDGIPRSARSARMYINGCVAPVAGNISMDSFLLDVTGMDIKAGDVVEYISENNTAASIADAAQTIPYEILTNLKGRNRKFYYGETNDSQRSERGALRK